MANDLLSALLEAAPESEVCRFVTATAAQQISVPRNAAGSFMEQAFCPEIASVMVAFAGGETISFPQYRDWRIRFLAKHGYPVNQIALQVGCTSRWVRATLAQGRIARPARRRAGDPRQMDLVDFMMAQGPA